MKPVVRIEGRAYPWGASNVDTDVIIPAHWLKTINRDGLGRGAFESVRSEPGNIFDDCRYAGAPILIAGGNFGCGSSREHAAWAIADMGIAAIVAPSFSDIFAGNAFKNGIITVELPENITGQLLRLAVNDILTVDLHSMHISAPSGESFDFTLDAFRRKCLMEGLDEIGVTLSSLAAIDSYERSIGMTRPWLNQRSA